MNLPQVTIAQEQEPVKRIDWVIHALLVATLAFLPLAFGTVEAWSELILVGMSGAMLLALGLRMIACRRGLPWTWVYVPVSAFTALAALQLLPLGKALVASLSPMTAATKVDLLSDLPSFDSLAAAMTLSFYPDATRHDLRIVVALIVIFLVVVTVYRTAALIKHLLGAIAVIGAVVASLSLLQTTTGTQNIYWLFHSGHRIADGGTFVNHSNFAQFMNLSVGAAMGLVLVRLYESFGGLRVTPAEVFNSMGQRRMLGVWALAAFAIVGIASVFVSLSRGGMIGCMIALTFLALMMVTKKSLRGRGLIMAAVALGAFLCILYIGFEAVHDRLATLREPNRADEGRLQIVQDIASAWTRYPLFGTGLGTHSVVYPMFDHSTSPSLAAHAENEYAQAAEETGALGLACLLVVGALIGWSFVRARRLTMPIRVAALGLGFGLVAILVQSFTDFGQHLPANAALSVVFCGLLVVISQLSGRKPDPASKPTGLLGKCVSGAVIVGLVLVTAAWSIPAAEGARQAEAHWRTASRMEDYLRTREWMGTNEDYAQLISEAAAAASAQPEHVEYRHWLGVYRWYAISRVRDVNGAVVVTPQTLGYAQRIIDELRGSRAVCPTFGATYCFTGQLECSVLGSDLGAKHIRKGYELGPCDPTACYVAGELDATQGALADSLAKMTRAVTLDADLFRDAVDFYVFGVSQPQLAVDLARGNAARLLAVAERLEESSPSGSMAAVRADLREMAASRAGQADASIWQAWVSLLSQANPTADLAARARADAVKLLEERCRRTDVRAWELAGMGDICASENDYSAAIDYYQRALAMSGGQVGWRLALAKTLAKAGKHAQAIDQARLCLRQQTALPAAQKLIAESSPKLGSGQTP